jgi:hypothetical protein
MRRVHWIVIDEHGNMQGIDKETGVPFIAQHISEVRYYDDFDEAVTFVLGIKRAFAVRGMQCNDWTVMESELVTRFMPADMNKRANRIWDAGTVSMSAARRLMEQTKEMK